MRRRDFLRRAAALLTCAAPAALLGDARRYVIGADFAAGPDRGHTIVLALHDGVWLLTDALDQAPAHPQFEKLL